MGQEKTGSVDQLLSVTSDPSSPPDGALWYRSDLDEFRGRANGVTHTLAPTPEPDVQEYVAGATWTKPAGARFLRVRCQSGGCAGGGAPTTAAGQTSAGAGGQGGSYAESWLDASAVTGTVAVTVGSGGTGVSGAQGNSGGTSSFGSYVSAAISSGGGSITAAAATGGAVNGGQGTPTMTGDIEIPGSGGGAGARLGATGAIGGQGGNSVMGSGGAATGNGAAGVPGTGYGGGGGGASNNPSGAARTGGAGTGGIVTVETFF